MDEKVSGQDFSADTYEDSYNIFIAFLKAIQTQKPPAYHRLMANLYRLVSYVIILVLFGNLLTLTNQD